MSASPSRLGGRSRWNSALCRSGQCGHHNHPPLTTEQVEVLRKARPIEGWRNGARVTRR